MNTSFHTIIWTLVSFTSLSECWNYVNYEVFRKYTWKGLCLVLAEDTALFIKELKTGNWQTICKLFYPKCCGLWSLSSTCHESYLTIMRAKSNLPAWINTTVIHLADIKHINTHFSMTFYPALHEVLLLLECNNKSCLHSLLINNQNLSFM